MFKCIEALLKCSQLARATAVATNFLDCLIERLEQTHSNLGMTCGEFVRRYGNAKLDQTLHLVQMHVNIILSWYGMDVLMDTKIIARMLRVFIRFWPWVSMNHDTLLRFMKMLAILSDDSLPGNNGIQWCHKISYLFTFDINSVQGHGINCDRKFTESTPTYCRILLYRIMSREKSTIQFGSTQSGTTHRFKLLRMFRRTKSDK